MEVSKQSVEVIGECPDTYGESISWIADAGRVCYRSEPVTDAETFLAKRLAPDPPHSSILEHSNLEAKHLHMSFKDLCSLNTSKWVAQNTGDISRFYGNLRAWMEALKLKHPKDVYEWVDSHGGEVVLNQDKSREMKRITVKLNTDRAVLAEITRHRNDVGFSVESQRYVDYNKSDIEFIEPSWFSDPEIDPCLKDEFRYNCFIAEDVYKYFRKHGLPAQHARAFLTNQVKTVIVMTAYLTEWDWIFKLRRAPGAYPQMRALMDMVHEEFVIRGWANG